MDHFAILADDFAGAGAAGVRFAAAGKKTALLFDRAGLDGVLAGHDAVALSTDCCFLAPDAAYAATANTIAACRRAGAEVFFMRIGPATTRENLGAGIEAALDALGYPAALVCPPTAEMGVGAQDRGLKSMPDDILALRTGLSIASLPLGRITAGYASLRRAISDMIENGSRIIIADTTDGGEVEVLGSILREAQNDYPTPLPRILPVGPDALVESFAGPLKMRSIPPLVHSQDSVRGIVPSQFPHRTVLREIAIHFLKIDCALEGKTLAVIDSSTPASSAQLDRLRTEGDVSILEIDMEQARTAMTEELSRILAGAEAAGDRHVVLTTGRHADSLSDQEAGHWEARVYGDMTAALCRRIGFEQLLVVGTGAALDVAAALGMKSMTLEGACLPGTVLGSCIIPDCSVRRFMTMPDDDGEPDAISRLLLAGRINSDRLSGNHLSFLN